jgi:hypothetical protein
MLKVFKGTGITLANYIHENKPSTNCGTFQVYIVDFSSSMLDASQKAIESILKYQGRTPDEVYSIITFASRSQLYTGNSVYMSSVRFSYGGTTHLSDGIDMLQVLINEFTNVSVCIITDGELHDGYQVTYKLKNMKSKLVSCLGIRYGLMGNTDVIAQLSSLTYEGKSNIKTINDSNNFYGVLLDRRTKHKVILPYSVHMYPGETATKELFVDNEMFLIQQFDGDAEKLTKPILESYLHQLLDYIKTNMLTNNLKNIDQIKSFLKTVESYYLENDCEMKHDNLRVSLLQKLKQDQTHKKGVLNEIRTCLNNANILNLRSQQEKAEWLNGCDSNRTLQRKEGNTDTDIILREVKLLDGKLVNEDDVCYISQLNTKENLEELKYLEGTHDLTVPQLLTLTGVVGLPISLTRYDYIDPWTVRINECYWGLRMNQNALFANKLKSIDCPGNPGKQINGVVPFGPNVDKFVKTSILDEHSGCFMRGTLGTIKGDTVALTVATIMHLLTEKESGAQEVLDSLIKLLPVNYFKNMDVDEISNISMLVGKYLCIGATQTEFEFLWTMFLYFKTKNKKWKSIMKYVVGYDESNVSCNPRLFTRDTKQSQYFNKKIVDERLLELNIFNKSDLNFFEMLAKKLNLEFNLDVKTIWRAISCDNRAGLKENLSKHPYHLISQFVRLTKTVHYNKLLLEKKKLENVCILQNQLTAMLECDTDRFKLLLAGKSYIDTEYGPMPPVGHIGTDTEIYTVLLNQLYDEDKLWFLITCRTRDGEIIWNNGNINPTLEDDLLNKLDKLKLLDEYVEFKTEYGILRYRNKRNRHEHGNDKPSYNSLSGGLCHTKDKYFETLSNTQQINYDDIHNDCCGNRKVKKVKR